jgi:ABC-type transport system involved in multi-copper enzyme maturation permease subunit
MNAVATALWNPIVAKEYRSRMRTWRSPVAMMVYVLLLGGLGWAIFASMASASGPFGFGFGQASNYGQTLFVSLVIFQMMLLACITPGTTAGGISGERERQTIDLLFVTRIAPFSIIWGKLLASMSFVLLLLMLSVPIFSLVFLFGGVELDQVLCAFLVTAVTALTLGVLGIAFSTLFRRTVTATVAAYGVAFILLAGAPAYGLLFATEIDPGATTMPAPPAVTFLSPIIPLMIIATNQPIGGYGVRYRGQGGGPSIQGGGTVCSSTNGGPPICYPVGGAVRSGGNVQFYQPPQAPGTIPTGLFAGWQYWQANVVMQLLICLIALSVSALVLPPVRHLPWRRRARAVPAALS